MSNSKTQELARRLEELLAKGKKVGPPVLKAPPAPVEGAIAEPAGTPVDVEQETVMATTATRKTRTKTVNGRKARIRKPRAAGRVKAERVKVTAEDTKDPQAGLNKKPKNKILFINRAPAQALVEQLLRAALKAGDLSSDQQFEATRLIARLEARA